MYELHRVGGENGRTGQNTLVVVAWVGNPEKRVQMSGGALEQCRGKEGAEKGHRRSALLLVPRQSKVANSQIARAIQEQIAERRVVGANVSAARRTNENVPPPPPTPLPFKKKQVADARRTSA